MGNGKGHGKIILFGEHFVVHGTPAIAGGISNSAVVEVKESDKNKMVTEQKVIEEMSLKGIENVIDAMGIRKKYAVNLSGDLPTYGGLGSSAAFCVALVNALADEQKIHLTKEQINKYAYEGEKAFHGNPSGIDNTMATYGGVMEFKRGTESNEDSFRFIEIKKPLHLAVTFTGKYSPTEKMISAVRMFKEQGHDEFNQLVDEYLELEAHAQKYIEKGKVEELGKLMNENQSILSELGVSDEKNDEINKLVLGFGALGAKLTGGGGGGCCIALANDEEHTVKIANEMKKKGFDSFPTVIAKK
ncbi:mevalonate kinase [Candidatus Micrarchaeota archaeon]|nr:mevalonate kinase [Candidatus Micrarchaeota archaeon]MBU1166245.1 mevalonate kinase [Candidatus Micrarchaeota archaeon]MBU1886798.1 mevalonate kinase [Candidatus Micrarchaeota archaeon]